MNETKPPSFLQNNNKLILIVVLHAILATLGVAVYFGIKSVRVQKTYTSAVNVPQPAPKEQVQEKNIAAAVDLLKDFKNMNPKILVSEWNTKYAVYVLRKNPPLAYYPFGKDKGFLLVNDEVAALNLETGEKKTYDTIEEIISKDELAFLTSVPPEISYRSYLELLRWSPFSENVFWGRLSIYSQADPPIAEKISLFKVDLKNSTTDKYILPSHGLYGAVKENTNAGKVLYENVGNGLSLYEYDLLSNEDTLIVTYGKEIFDQYCGSFIEYVYTTPFYGDCGRERSLRPDWEKEGVSYYDFVSGKKMTVKNREAAEEQADQNIE